MSEAKRSNAHRHFRNCLRTGRKVDVVKSTRLTPEPTFYTGRHSVPDGVTSTYGQGHCLPESCPKIGDLPKSPNL